MSRRSQTWLGIVAAFGAGLVVGTIRPAWGEDPPEDRDGIYRHLAVFARVLSYVERNFVEEVPSRALVYGAIRGMVGSLDAYSAFLEPEQFQAMRNEAQGEFGGVGVELALRAGRLVVVEVFANAHAEKAGLRVGDILRAVDGRSVDDVGLFDAVAWIKGRAGTKVALTIEREQTTTVTVRRERIRISTVLGRRLDDGVGLLRIRTFAPGTAYEVIERLRALQAEGPLSGLVLDLRDNPGGLLEEAIRVADLWLASGVIVSTESRRREPDVSRAHPRETEPNYPVVALINGGTASAAEIVAGALAQNDRAVLVGSPSFGKGSVQTVIELEDASALKLTVARYFTPDHVSIEGRGITPDVIAHDPRAASVVSAEVLRDPQLESGLAVMGRWRQLGFRAAKRPPPGRAADPGPTRAADPGPRRAVEDRTP